LRRVEAETDILDELTRPPTPRVEKGEAKDGDHTYKQALRPMVSRVLEGFQGFVVKINEPWAHVTLTSENGEELAGTYPAEELAARGVGERDRFTLETIDRGATVGFDIKLVLRRVVSPAAQLAIREAIVRELGDYSPGNDY